MKSVILLSGGIDSTVLLAERLAAGDDVLAVFYRYGQLHLEREQQAMADVADHYQVQRRIVWLPDIFGTSALRGHGELPHIHAEQPDATTVPARNLVFLATGVAVAESIGARTVLFGATKDDAAGYIDCRAEFITAMSEAAYHGTATRIAVAAPYHHIPKRAVVDIGNTLNVPFGLTWSCYRGGDTPCGACGACQSRDEAMA